MRLAGLRVDRATEALERLLRPAIGDDTLDRRDRRTDTGDLRLRLSATPDHAEGGRALPRQIPGRDAARRTGPEPAELIRLQHSHELRCVDAEQHDDECGARRAEPGVDLRT